MLLPSEVCAVFFTRPVSSVLLFVYCGRPFVVFDILSGISTSIPSYIVYKSLTMANTNQTAKITLHWLEVSRSHRILWLLEELGVPYELKTYKRGKDKLADPKLKEVHPLGKSPVITVEAPGAEKPLVIAESGAIAEYLCDYYGKWLIPKRYREGQEDRIGGESESWLRHRFFMHYAEGSIMPLMLMAYLVSSRAFYSPFVPFITHSVQISRTHLCHSLLNRSRTRSLTR